MTIEPTHLAWLAGIYDGEGSIGINRQQKRGRTTGADFVIFPQVQIQMTHVPTIERVVELTHALGLRAVAYHWAERKPQHKDACGIRIVKTGYVHTMATALEPYAVTKREQWQIVKEFCQLRIDRVGLLPSGDLKRGGRQGWWVPYSEREVELYEHIASLNRRGRTADRRGEMAAEDGSVEQRL
ncbi:hypothetical protein B0E38_01810 [Streptomyces sp. 111WW2]|uniref:hypothetical protein n=1 Tax=Streptomyces sp. 111WW2 TaxID=1945515 RepID=UPI000D0C95BB|nr:hypothetical protein [Streptomyces sp. 111WW2]PSK57965.1 hypothetical protein B0E38_01810 [Streptomyces sp. 111WW2]